MKKSKKWILFILIVLVVSAGAFVAYFYLNKVDKQVKRTVTLDEITEYGYSLRDDATNIYKEEYNNLKAILKEENLNNEEYVKSVAKLFIIDLYTITNKINKYDVGGEMFVYPDGIANFKLNVQDTIYKYVEDNTYGDRNQELPEVSKIDITNFDTTKYKIGDTEYDGYKINLKWEYAKDLEYDSEGEVIVIFQDKNCYVVEKN